MPAPYTVVVADFLEEPGIEEPILRDDARLVLAKATDEEGLARFAPEADAFLLFHDLARLGEATLARAPKCKCVVRAGVGYNNVDLEAATRRGAKRSGACTISGMRAAPSKKFILYQRPRSPSMSPWSASTTITVSSANPALSSALSSRPT